MLALLLVANYWSFGQGRSTVSGTVVNELGESLEGATVKIVNGQLGIDQVTTTDAHGIFGFTNLPAGSGYSFTATTVGYEAGHIGGYLMVAGDGNTLSLELKQVTTELEQIVVVGYGNTKRENLIGAIQSVREEDFNSGVFSSPSQLLQGKVAGLNITRSGDPNSKGATILRGPSTLRDGAQEPFYVIDGVPGASLDLLRPTISLVSMC